MLSSNAISALAPAEGSAVALNPAKTRNSRPVSPGEFEAEAHFYPRVLNATIHPLVGSFFSLGNERILARYSHLNPQYDINILKSLLQYDSIFFKWAGKKF